MKGVMQRDCFCEVPRRVHKPQKHFLQSELLGLPQILFFPDTLARSAGFMYRRELFEPVIFVPTCIHLPPYQRTVTEKHQAFK